VSFRDEASEASQAAEEACRDANPGRSPAAPCLEIQDAQEHLKRGQTPDEGTADVIVAGLAANAFATLNYSRSLYGDNIDLTALLNSLVSSAERVNAGDLGQAEAMLAAQAATLNAMFANLVLGSMNAQIVQSAERYMRLGLRAQAQCRATLETLAAIKNPPTVIAKQANIANGPQQVNNTAQLWEGSRVRAIPKSAPTELLEAHVERVDGRETPTAVSGNQTLEAVALLNGSEDTGR
jgi:hypothetical protein